MKFTVNSKTLGILTIHIDPQDAHYLRNYVWYAAKKGDQIYFRRYLSDRQPIALHREIVGASEDQIVRFKNGDNLDLRRANLLKEPAELARGKMVANMRAVVSLRQLVGV